MAGLYVIIAGAGKVGWNLARELLEKGDEVTVIEQDRRRYLTVEQELEHAVQYGDATELWVLERAGIQRADLVVAVTGDDEDNLLISQVAKEKYLCERIIARCNNPRNLTHFKLLGIQPAVSATDLILRLIEHEVPRYGLVHLLDLPEEHLEIIELIVGEGSDAAGRKVADVDPARGGAGDLGAARRGRLRPHRGDRGRGGRRGARRARPGARGGHHALVRLQRRRWLTGRSGRCSSAAAWPPRGARTPCSAAATAAACCWSAASPIRRTSARRPPRAISPGGWRARTACCTTATGTPTTGSSSPRVRASCGSTPPPAPRRSRPRRSSATRSPCSRPGPTSAGCALEGGQLDGIHYLRALANADAIRADAEGAAAVVLAGGSYIACEVAATLTALGRRCTLVMLEDAPLSTHFGPTMGAFTADLLRAHGVELVCGDAIERLEGDGRVARVVTASGRELAADMVVMGTGVVPDVMLARSAGLELGESGGVRCSARLETSAPGVWAAGDMCEYDSVLHAARVRIEHHEVALAHGKAAAAAMLGTDAPFAEVPYFWSDLADWCTAEWVGLTEAPERELIRGSVADGAFCVLHLAGDRLVAALSVGRPEDLMPARGLIAERVPLAGRDAELVGGDLEALLPPAPARARRSV